MGMVKSHKVVLVSQDGVFQAIFEVDNTGEALLNGEPINSGNIIPMDIDAGLFNDTNTEEQIDAGLFNG